MKPEYKSSNIRIRLLIILAVLAFLPSMIMFLEGNKTYLTQGPITGRMIATTVSIMPQSENMIYEDNGTEFTDDFIFQIGPINSDNNWYSYNATYGGIHSGYDIGIGSDSVTQTFTIRNMGTISIDITVASSDFDNTTRNDNIFIDVNQSNGSLQIYIPSIGWKNVPDNDDNDDDRRKEITELCIADNLMINETITGIDFQLRPQPGLQSGNYTGKIVFTSYDSAKINPCSGAGNYTIP